MKDKIFCGIRKRWSYIEVCRNCRHRNSCQDYQKWKEPEMFGEKPSTGPKVCKIVRKGGDGIALI